MRVGTPGFNGERLREARDARGISAVSLSEIVNVSAQQVYNYENNRNSPSPEILTRIARAINLPEAFFVRPRRDDNFEKIFYRSMSSATKGARKRAERRLGWLTDIEEYVSEFVTLPRVNLPKVDVPSDPLLLSDQDVENLAEDVRRYWRMGEGPVANMVLLLENQGVVISRGHLGAETLDSLSTFDERDGRPYISIGTDKGTAARWRFDAAHELGHLLLHSQLDRSLLTKSAQFKRIEEQAHRFAAAFLVPIGPFSSDLFGMSLDALLSVKLKWNVSVAMMIIRARHAGLLSEDAERKLWIGYNRRKWRRNEPYEDAIEIEKPRVLRRAFELILDNGEQTSSDVLAQLALAAADVEALSGLDDGYLSGHARVSLLDDPTRRPARVISIEGRRHG
jgi:Zn-dependent peptidase ImmA (M78 family)/DNA-binding XRE family transcriptional regulator